MREAVRILNISPDNYQDPKPNIDELPVDGFLQNTLRKIAVE